MAAKRIGLATALVACAATSGAAASGAAKSHASAKLVAVTYVSRHGVRTPYPPPVATADDWSAYTPLKPPDASAWGMSQEAFETQELTPHGEGLIKLMGRYFRSKWDNMSLFDDTTDPCHGGLMVAYADDSTRDIQTAQRWLEGFGCHGAGGTASGGGVPVHVANGSLPEMVPVLNDGTAQPGCELSTEEQVDGLYGGNVDALTTAYAGLIDKVEEVLQMAKAPNSSKLCEEVNVDTDYASPPVNCSLYDLQYAWTGLYFEGMFTSPLYYAQYFAEAWMLQYLGGLAEWAWGALTVTELTEMYAGHIKTLRFGSNYWNARTYGSAQLGYVLSALTQAAEYDAAVAAADDDGVKYDTKALPGLSLTQPMTRALLLFCHDTNILYLRQLLGLSWLTEGQETNAASTGGALGFELWQESGEYSVKIHYTAATPQQQRYATNLTLAKPPAESYIIIPECGSLYCPLADFQRIAADRLNRTCIAEPLASTVGAIVPGGKEHTEGTCGNIEGWEAAVIAVAAALAAGLLVFVHLKTVQGQRPCTGSADSQQPKEDRGQTTMVTPGIQGVSVNSSGGRAGYGYVTTPPPLKWPARSVEQQSP